MTLATAAPLGCSNDNRKSTLKVPPQRKGGHGSAWRGSEKPTVCCVAGSAVGVAGSGVGVGVVGSTVSVAGSGVEVGDPGSAVGVAGSGVELGVAGSAAGTSVAGPGAGVAAGSARSLLRVQPRRSP